MAICYATIMVVLKILFILFQVEIDATYLINNPRSFLPLLHIAKLKIGARRVLLSIYTTTIVILY